MINNVNCRLKERYFNSVDFEKEQLSFMNSQEIVGRTLEHSYPERVARSFWQSDLLAVEHTVKTHATDWQKLSDGRWQRNDEWANVWARLDSTSKGEVIKGITILFTIPSNCMISHPPDATPAPINPPIRT